MLWRRIHLAVRDALSLSSLRQPFHLYSTSDVCFLFHKKWSTGCFARVPGTGNANKIPALCPVEACGYFEPYGVLESAGQWHASYWPTSCPRHCQIGGTTFPQLWGWLEVVRAERTTTDMRDRNSGCGRLWGQAYLSSRGAASATAVLPCLDAACRFVAAARSPRESVGGEIVCINMLIYDAPPQPRETAAAEAHWSNTMSSCTSLHNKVWHVRDLIRYYAATSWP